MSRKKVLSIIGGLAAGLILSGSSSADWRGYVWTYEYQTMSQGTREAEYYFTTEVPERDSAVNTMKHWFELEYGLTDRWDIAAYLQYKQKNKKEETDFSYDGFKIRTRYRIGEKGRYALDPLLYLEYKKDNDGSTPDKVEVKAVLARDFGRVNIAYNQVLEQELERTGETEHGYAFGINYKFNPTVKLGVESKGNYTGEKYYAGPTVSMAKGAVWFAAGIVWGLNEQSDDIQTRMIVGIPF